VRKSKKRHHWLIATTALLALGACDKAGTNPTGTFGGADAADPAQAKVDTYVEGYNKLIGTFGLPETADKYEEQDIPGKAATDSIYVNTGWIDQALAKLKEARALPGGPADLDKAGDRLIAALDTLLARLGPLHTYYESKAYKEDNLARGKSEHAQLMADFKAAMDSSEAFNALLKRERNARTGIEIAELKKQGNTLGYTSKLALQKSEQLVDLFNKPEDIRNPAMIARGDSLVVEIEKLLAEQRAAFATAKAAAKSPADAPDISYSLLEGNLTSMVGNYRDMKQSHNVDAAKRLVDSYNEAVESMNRIR